MESFDRWILLSTHPCIKTWSVNLLTLGVSWDSFHRDDNEILQDLRSGGIPTIASHDICKIAKDEIARSQAPMAIFWDIECLPIPKEISGVHCCSRLKSALCPFGDLVQFRGYASIGLNLIPQNKRSELHLSGCHLVDCPHNGRKEVADKMIIVDAMKFAYDNPNCATLCFVTGDQDYAYLLAVLKQQPQWRTIVISKGSDENVRMLHVNCDERMSWETDILGISSRLLPPPGFEPRNEVKLETGIGNYTETGSSLGRDPVTRNQRSPLYQPLIHHHSSSLLKKGIINESEFISSIEKNPTLGTNKTNEISLKLSQKFPFKEKELPQRALEVVSKRPFLLCVPWNFCSKGKTITGENKPFTVQSSKGIIFMFSSLRKARQATTQNEWLQYGLLVDWRDIATLTKPEVPIKKSCLVCHESCFKTKMLESSTPGDMFCESCFKKSPLWNSSRREHAIRSVVEVLEIWEQNDDVFVFSGILCKSLCEGWPNECASKADAALWISEAVSEGKVIQTSRQGSKSTIVFLPHLSNLVLNSTSSDCIDTSMEEEFVIDFLWKNGGAMPRLQLITELKFHFKAKMESPLNRKAVFSNGMKKKSFFVSRSRDNQTVGLSHEDARNILSM